jgi:hypothetical protein
MQTQSPVHVLALIASPSDQPFDTETEWQNLSDALVPLTRGERLILERLARPTEMALKQRLAERAWDILHFVGNCRSQSARYATLMLEGQGGHGRAVTAQHFGTLLQSFGSLRLVVVQAAMGQDEACENVGARLIEQGVPAVVVARGGAGTRAFYAALIAGVSLSNAASPPWAVRCMLHNSGAGGLIFKSPVEAAPASLIQKVPTIAPAIPDDETRRIQQELHRKQAAAAFDVFLCHHTVEKPAVKKIAKKLMGRGILPWLDEWELRPGMPWQRLLEEQIASINAAAVFVGSDGVGPWQRQELDAFLRAFAARACPVIPVLLESAPDQPKLPLFLEGMTWVDFRTLDPDPLERLIWGITGRQIWQR